MILQIDIMSLNDFIQILFQKTIIFIANCIETFFNLIFFGIIFTIIGTILYIFFLCVSQDPLKERYRRVRDEHFWFTFHPNEHFTEEELKQIFR